MLIKDIILEKQIWARNGQRIVRKYRCSGGRRHGRVVSSPSSCFAPIDVQKRIQIKKTKSRLGPRMIRKSRKTKKFNPASKRLQALNK